MCALLSVPRWRGTPYCPSWPLVGKMVGGFQASRHLRNAAMKWFRKEVVHATMLNVVLCLNKGAGTCKYTVHDEHAKGCDD
eukprot:1161913-Pelagomonas_calceolata.AAC.2